MVGNVQSEDRARMQQANGASPRILLVEDDPDSRDAISETLAEAGYLVECVGNGGEALARLTAPPLPAAILSDVLMPVVGGEELVTRLAGASVPIILMSGMPGLPGVGGVRVVQKPMTVAELLRAIAEALAGAAPPTPIV
jgi:CheY-like chemotaxis protein